MKTKRPFMALLLAIFVAVSLNANCKDIKTTLVKDTSPPSVSFTFCQCCGRIYNGLADDMPMNSTRTGIAAITMDPIQSYNYKLSYTGNLPSLHIISWEASIVEAKDAKLVVTFSDVAGNDTTLTFIFKPILMTIRPTNIDFGLLAKGDTAIKKVWIINETKHDTIIEIDDLRMKFQDQGFDINNVQLPLFILPHDSTQIQVRFIATVNGDFTDSIGLGDTCVFNYKGGLKAKVGSPIIDVTDWDFGDIPVNTNSPGGQITITNKGTVQLNITGYSLPASPVFTTDLRDITPQSPLVIGPGQQYTYNVYFSPDSVKSYLDSMVFSSNSAKVSPADSLAIFQGKGISPSLVANSYDWGQRVIEQPGLPAGPYDANPGDSIIMLKNDGSMYVDVRGIKIIEDSSGFAFEFNMAALTNVRIPDSSQLYVPVKFHPTKVGLHKLVISYDNNAGSNTQTVLQGIGVLPNAVNENYNNTHFSIIPNPASTAFTLKYESSTYSKLQISIFDLLGNEVFNSSEECNIGMNEILIDCSGLGMGYYIVRLMQNGRVETKAVVIIKN